MSAKDWQHVEGLGGDCALCGREFETGGRGHGDCRIVGGEDYRCEACSSRPFCSERCEGWAPLLRRLQKVAASFSDAEDRQALLALCGFALLALTETEPDTLGGRE